MSNDHIVRGATIPGTNDGSFAPHHKAEPDPGEVLPPPGSPTPETCPVHKGPWGKSMSCDVCTDHFGGPRNLPDALRSAQKLGLPLPAGFNPNIERMIADRILSPGARGMSPREAVEQYAEAVGASLAERCDLLREVGLLPRLKASEVVCDDSVDLEPVIREFGDPEGEHAGDYMAANTEYAVIESIDVDGDAIVLHTTQGSWAVPANYELETDLGLSFSDHRCWHCGEALNDRHPQLPKVCKREGN